MFAGAAGALLSVAGKQRIVLTVDKAIFEGYQVSTKFGEYINDEINALLCSGGNIVTREV